VSTEHEQSGRGADARQEPTEDELRAAYEAELARLTTADLIAQSIVSLLNMAARRLGPPGGEAPATGAPAPHEEAAAAASERDLDQVRDAIDAVRALLEILERRIPEGLKPLRDALSELQMAYAREVQAGAGGAAGGSGQVPGGGGAAGGGEAPGGGQGPDAGQAPGGAEAPGGGAEEAPEPSGSPGEPGPAQRSGRLWVPGT
jgi:hypothetical protein